MSNPTVKQTHIVLVLVSPIVEVWPRFQWTPIGGVANFECRYETFVDDYDVLWFKNDEQLMDNGVRITLLNNGTQLQVAAVEQTDTGAYTCRVVHSNQAISGQSVASLLVQDETVEVASAETRPQRLWIFHATGLSIIEGICGQPIHEIDARDTIYQNSLTLCGYGTNGPENTQQTEMDACQWSDNIVVLNDHVFIAQPNLNRIIVFQASQLNVVQVMATDPRPSRLWAMESGKENQIWVLCEGNSNYFEKQQSFSHQTEEANSGSWPMVNSIFSSINISASGKGEKFEFLSDKYFKNRKTIQVVRLPDSYNGEQRIHHANRQADVIHLQPVDGHFDLVYDLFMPNHYESIFRSEEVSKRVRIVMQESSFAYATHWEERSLVKISLHQLEYMQSIRLADCQPIAASVISRRSGGLVAVQCQTPVTHQLNGQLILDQVTDAILSHNLHLNAHQSYLSPDQRYLVNILHEHNNNSNNNCIDVTKCHIIVGGDNQQHQPIINTSTIIVQRINDNGIEFMYDVRTSLDIVSCIFVWKNGNYDLVLASGTHNREDLLYLSLIDGHVELISGIGRPTEG